MKPCVPPSFVPPADGGGMEIIMNQLPSSSGRNSFLLLITAFIWGTAFVSQSLGGIVIGAFSFTALRSLIGAVMLIPVIRVLDRTGKSEKKPVTTKQKQTLAIGGILCGIMLCGGTNLQQIALNMGASTGKTGFLTATYILIVPILGLFLKRRCGWNVWVAVFITLAGLYLLCMNQSGLRLQLPDILTLFSALFFALQILVIDYFSPKVDGVRLSCIQFAVTSFISFIPGFWTDMNHSVTGVSQWLDTLSSWQALLPILYVGILSNGVAYTLQIIGQNGVNPAIACLIMSLESVFATLSGWVVLHQTLSVRELTGCALIFIAVVLAQIPVPERHAAAKPASPSERIS